MTSEATGGKTLQYFSNRNWFGMKKENLVVFEQFMLPCFTFDGKLILDQPYSIARAPGNMDSIIQGFFLFIFTYV